MSLAYRRFVFAIFALVLALSTSNGFADGMPKKKAVRHRQSAHAVHKKHAAHVKKAHKTKKTTSQFVPPEVRGHMPPPGHDGQERDDWFMRRRTWPDETIDPNAYPTALTQAARMPVYGENSRNYKLSTMQWQCIGPYSIDGRVTCIATHPTDSNLFYVG